MACEALPTATAGRSIASWWTAFISPSTTLGLCLLLWYLPDLPGAGHGIYNMAIGTSQKRWKSYRKAIEKL